MTTRLTDAEYKNTMTQKMIDVTVTAEPDIDIWEYVAELTAENVVLKYVLENTLVEKVYRNETNTFDHVLLPTDGENVFEVIIVDLIKKNIKGNFRLDLNIEYGKA